MIQKLLSRSGAALFKAGGASLLGALGVVSLLGATPVTAAPLPYPQAVAYSDVAAQAVLARAGRETCLRGKLTRALVGLSNSCEASGTRNSLCSFADEAVVVTPMSLAFMDDTSRQLLKLIHPGNVPPAAKGQFIPEGSAPAEP